MGIRRHLPCVVMAAGAAVTVWGSFRPWLTSGSAPRSSYELLGLVDRLGVGRSGPLEWAVRLWPLMPLLVVIATAAIWAGRHRIGGTTAVVGGAYAATVAAVVGLTPDDRLVRSSNGTTITLVGALVFVLAACVSIVVSRGAGTPPCEPVRTDATPRRAIVASSPSRPR